MNVDTEDVIPVWMQPIELSGWPTQRIESTDLHYWLLIPANWNPNPHISQNPLQIEHYFQGIHPAELVTIGFMDKAEPNSDMRNWVDAFLKLTGFPILPMFQVNGSPPQLMEWQYEGNFPALSDRFNVDETHLYQGLAQFPNHPSDLARLYILLARRGSFAWKVSVSILSACFPGTLEDTIATNDHVRAGAILGYLRFV
ncbi:MAG: hypothetical protein KME30_27945 [Iphinoe sp. HA4291-MV1]|nr:hypothetical protein [Iphinoe sp. HA4291-MV1]